MAVDSVGGGGFIIFRFYWTEMESSISDLLCYMTLQFVLLHYFIYSVSKRASI